MHMVLKFCLDIIYEIDHHFRPGMARIGLLGIGLLHIILKKKNKKTQVHQLFLLSHNGISFQFIN